jgi:hypothetical protein
MLKKWDLVLKLVVFICLSIGVNTAYAESDKKISHVVMVWLNEPGNAEMRQKFIKASNQLNDLPGIVNRHVGVVVSSDRSIVNDTFDVAVTVTLENKKALKAYLNHPKHKKILHDQIKPLVNRTVAYDFISE